MKPKDRYLSRMGPSVPVGGLRPLLQLHHQQPLHPHLHHHQQQQQAPHRQQQQQQQLESPSPPQEYQSSAEAEEEEEEEWPSEPMDLRVKKQPETSLESLMYGELAARYMLLNAEMREKQLSSLLPLLLLRPFASSTAAAAATSSSKEETQLRLADTTELVDERKRVTRPLTGRYVRHGTGASPATLITLRNMIQERQRQRTSHHVQPLKSRRIRRRK